MSGQESGEKTEQPTPKKERDARKKGQVARSQEVVTTASLMSVIAYLWLTWDTAFDRLVLFMDQIAALHGQEFRTAAAQATISAFNESVAILAPLLAIVIVADILGNYLQFGTVFSGESVSPKLEKISPIQGFKRIFSLKQLFEVLKSVVKIVFLSGLLFIVGRNSLAPYLNSVECGMPCMILVTGGAMTQILLFSALAFVIVAALDFMFQRKQHTKSLMMTKEEVKREFKESEGDPIIKGKRKQLAQELAMSDGAERTRKATAVVVNPTHFAVAIDYQPDITPLPVVVAKGRNLYAHHLRMQAEEAGVPIFRNVPLARGLYAETDVDEYVPDELFDAVAEILVWVSHNKGQLYQGRLEFGDLDMELGDHKISDQRPAAKPGFSFEN